MKIHPPSELDEACEVLTVTKLRCGSRRACPTVLREADSGKECWRTELRGSEQKSKHAFALQLPGLKSGDATKRERRSYDYQSGIGKPSCLRVGSNESRCRCKWNPNSVPSIIARAAGGLQNVTNVFAEMWIEQTKERPQSNSRHLCGHPPTTISRFSNWQAEYCLI